MGSFFFHCVFFFFFLMIRRPPRSPLFPYTPLSRSRRARGGSGRVRATPAFHPHRAAAAHPARRADRRSRTPPRSEEHTSELQSLAYLVCRLLLEKKKKKKKVQSRNKM